MSEGDAGRFSFSLWCMLCILNATPMMTRQGHTHLNATRVAGVPVVSVVPMGVPLANVRGPCHRTFCKCLSASCRAQTVSSLPSSSFATIRANSKIDDRRPDTSSTCQHQATSLYTVKPARRSIISVVPLEIQFDVWMCPEARAGCISPEIVRIAFHGTVYSAYHTGSSSILCG